MGYYNDINLRLENSDSAFTATRDFTNVIDCQSTPVLSDLGIVPKYIDVTVTEAFNNCTSITIDIRTDSTSNLDTSETTHISRTIALAALTLGATFRLQLPAGQQNYERYLGGEVTVTGTAPTTGKLAVYVTPVAESYQYFPDGSSIL